MDNTSGTSKGGSKTGKTSGGGSSLGTEEDSESESESSSSSSSSVLSANARSENVTDELESFRQRWKTELNSAGSENKEQKDKVDKVRSSEEAGTSSATTTSFAFVTGVGSDGSQSVEDQAKHWFLTGVGLERKGELYEAVRCYRRAIQLVPDIEYRLSSAANTAASNSETTSLVGSPEDSEDEEEGETEDCDDEGEPLIEKFLKTIEAAGWVFFRKAKDDDKIHLNDVPVEVLSYILRWVISTDLDVRSLDVLSNTCRGFYCLCRDEKLWQMACEKVWSDAVESEKEFPSYREMFLKRSRVRFDGCYICKVTYIRAGEQSFQDQSYRPWHFVEYYRYIRFLPNGVILFLTTSDEPGTSVSGLRDAKYPKNPTTMRGHYQLYGKNVVSAVVKKTAHAVTPVYRGRNSKVQTQEVTTFHMEFEICQVKHRPNWMLKWLHYAVYISRYPVGTNRNVNQNQLNANPTVVTSTTFDLNPSKFPPLYFSRVRSYTSKSEGILTP